MLLLDGSLRSEHHSSAPSTMIPGWAADAGGVLLRIGARVAPQLVEGYQDTMPHQLISHFCRRRISSSDEVAAEHAHFIIPQPHYRINDESAWEVQTQRMFYLVAANYVRRADLDLLAQVFRRYTYAVLDLFPITELVFMEFFSIVEIPVVAPNSASDSRLRYLIPPETYEYFFEDDDDVHVLLFGRGQGTASPAAVEGLQMVTRSTTGEDNSGTVEGLGLQMVTRSTTGEDSSSSCPICLDDFEEMSQVLAMPCGHPFHEGCLMEWLKRSHSCPLCRFSLPAAE